MCSISIFSCKRLDWHRISRKQSNFDGNYNFLSFNYNLCERRMIFQSNLTSVEIKKIFLSKVICVIYWRLSEGDVWHVSCRLVAHHRSKLCKTDLNKIISENNLIMLYCNWKTDFKYDLIQHNNISFTFDGDTIPLKVDIY